MQSGIRGTKHIRLCFNWKTIVFRMVTTILRHIKPPVFDQFPTSAQRELYSLGILGQTDIFTFSKAPRPTPQPANNALIQFKETQWGNINWQLIFLLQLIHAGEPFIQWELVPLETAPNIQKQEKIWMGFLCFVFLMCFSF